MPRRIRHLVLSLLLVASVAAIPAPVFGSSAADAGSASGWTALGAPRGSLSELVQRARPLRYRPDGVRAYATETTEETGAQPYFVKGTRGMRPQRSYSSTSRATTTGTGPIAYTRTEILDPTQDPFVLHGKLFVDFAAASGVCSATIVTSATENVVLTAGHCLKDPATGEDSAAAFFAPGYRNGTAPFGFWQATGFQVTDEWAASAGQGGDPRFDIGAIQVQNATDGTTLQDAFGSRGVMFNVDFRQQFDSFGYPAAPPFDGEKLWTCASDFGFQDTQFPGPPFTTGMGCDMTPGSSGGGWVINDEFLNSVVSYGLEGEPEVQYGPYFGTTAQQFYEVVSGVDQPDPTEEEHPMSLSLRLRRHLIAKGTLTADDGYTPCAIGAPIGLFRFNRSTEQFSFLKETVTSSTGTWRIKVRDKTGHYIALAPEGPVDELNFCLEALSDIKRHRH